jgi:hypothetical protein
MGDSEGSSNGNDLKSKTTQEILDKLKEIERRMLNKQIAVKIGKSPTFSNNKNELQSWLSHI